MNDAGKPYARPYLTEAQYLALCDACDRVLLAADSSEVRVAIPWLHVIREHPVILAGYTGLFEPESLAEKACTPLHALERLMRVSYSILRRGRAGPTSVPPLPRALDVLFVSHLLNSASAGAEDDFYFGPWPRILADRGYSVGVALLNHSGAQPQSLAGAWDGSAVPRMILSRSLAADEEWRLLKLLAAEAARLCRAARAEPDPLSRRVLARASAEALSSGAFESLRIARQLSAIVKLSRPGAIVVTHEGHSWERLALSSARSVMPGIRCIAYQHALIFRLQHALLRDLQPQYNPGYVLTSGEAARERFASRPRSAAVTVDDAGSTRGDALASRGGAARDGVAADNDVRAGCCLVLPEGHAGECHLLLSFAVRCAGMMPEVRFILRLHPMIRFEQLVAENEDLRRLPSNVALSTASLDDDIARSSWTLYRGSTAAVQAVAVGVAPIYLRVRGELTIDPLYEGGDRVARVDTAEEFAAAVRKPPAEADAAYLRALCARLFSPSNVDTLLECLPAPARAPR